MKLYRYEVFTGGEWEGIWMSCKYHNVFSSWTEEQEELYWDKLALRLHSPNINDFKNKIEPSEKAKFYFTKLGKNNFEQYIQMLLDSYTAICVNHRIIELDLNQCNKYECFYQDENQICIEIKED